MADSHIRSNWVGEDGTQEITGFRKVQADRVACATLNATAVVCGGTLSAAGAITGTASITATTFLKSTTYTHATTYIKVGTKKYIFTGSATTSPTVVAAATALVATPIKGSLYLGAGILWVFDADTTATKMS